MIKDKLVVVITLNYNQSKMTLECVDSILKSDYSNFKLIVVDNGSNEKEYKILTDYIKKDIIIERIDENCGYVCGVNRGLFKASVLDLDYFIIMNNDTIIDSKAIRYLVGAAKKYNDYAIVSGKVYHFDRPNVFQYVGGVFKDKRYLKMNNLHKEEIDIGQCDEEKERDMLDDIFWLLPNKIFKDIGYYSDNFFLYAEQADYAIKAKNKGYKLIFTPKAKLWHKGSITSGDGNRFSPKVNFWRNKSSIIYKYRNTKKKYFYWDLLISLTKKLSKNIWNIFNFEDSGKKKSDYAALIGMLYGFKWIINKKPDNGYNPFIK